MPVSNTAILILLSSGGTPILGFTFSKSLNHACESAILSGVSILAFKSLSQSDLYRTHSFLSGSFEVSKNIICDCDVLSIEFCVVGVGSVRTGGCCLIRSKRS